MTEGPAQAGEDLLVAYAKAVKVARVHDEIVSVLAEPISERAGSNQLKSALAAAGSVHERVAETCLALSAALDGGP